MSACSMGDSKFVQDINSPNMEGVVAKTPNHILMKDGMGLEKLSSPITIKYALTGPENESFFGIANMRAVLNEEGKVTSYVMRKVPQFGVDVLSVGTIGNSNDYSVTVNSLEALVNYLDETPYFKVTNIKETTTEKAVPEITTPDDPENEADKTAFANYYQDVYGTQSYSIYGFMYPDDEATKVLSNPVRLDIQGVKEIKSEDRVESYLQNNYSTAGKLDVSITPGFTVVDDGENHFYYTIVIKNATEDGGEYLVAFMICALALITVLKAMITLHSLSALLKM